MAKSPSSDKVSGINWFKVLELPEMRNDDGSPNVPVLIRFLEEDVTSWISKHDITCSEIEEALTKLYEKYPEGGFDVQGICSRALAEIPDIPSGTEAKVIKRIGAYLRTQSNMFRAGKDGKWFVSPGAGARVKRVTPEFADDYWNKQEAKAAKENG